MFKKVLVSVLVFFMLITTTISLNAFAEGSEFTDLEPENWAYKFAKKMVDRGIMKKDSKGKFNPNDQVTRGEFAVYLVDTLDLTLKSPSTSTFIDIDKGSAIYSYVETAKYYLTGYRNSKGQDLYKPEEYTVREDLAVAIVKALGYQDGNYSSAKFNTYQDKDSVSKSLQKYMLLAVENGLLSGYTEGGKKYLKPQRNITKAETATILSLALNTIEQKVTYDDEKITYDEDNLDEDNLDEDNLEKANVTIREDGDKLYLNWNNVNKENFQYYKVVLSKYNNSPAYPDDGYLVCTTNNECVVKAYDGYNGGDVGGRIEEGQSYYVSITSVYNDKKVKGNVVKATIPVVGEQSYGDSTTSIKAVKSDNSVKVNWDQVSNQSFKYYKVVLSKYDSTPQYPENGYITYITNPSTTEYYIHSGAKYNGNNDFGGIVHSGESYYLSVTCVYDYGKYTSNVLKITIP